jgi:hypothetical protein
MAPKKRVKRKTKSEDSSKSGIDRPNPVLDDESLRKEFAKAFDTSMLVITDPCPMCLVDLDPVTKQPFADPSKPFLFAAVGVVTREGVVDADELYVARTGQLSSTDVKPLVFHMAPGRVSILCRMSPKNVVCKVNVQSIWFPLKEKL